MLNAFQQDKNRLEPSWYATRAPILKTINPTIHKWLYDLDSLTAKLKIACGQRAFNVQVRSQSYHMIYPNEARILDLPSRRVNFIREVHLYCGLTPVVFARTCIPMMTLSGRYQQFARLGRKPLGEILFTDPHISRNQVEVACFTPSHIVYARAMQPMSEHSDIWGRRSLFQLPTQQQLLVTEIFLPTIQEIPLP